MEGEGRHTTPSPRDQNLGRPVVDIDIIIPRSFSAFQQLLECYAFIYLHTHFQLKVVDTNGGGTLSMTEAKKIAFVSNLSLL